MFSFLKIRQSVDSIISDIEAKVAALNVAAEFHAAEADMHSVAALIKTELSAVATSESQRAKVIAAKLAALIS